MNEIYFTINGERFTLAGSDVTPDTSLNDYLRHHVNLRGTKAMCHEGGCGACVVSVARIHPVTKEMHTFAVNSCLVHVLSCHRWNITTVEGVGNAKNGYHTIQTRLAAFNGTQCGYCTPGWVMNAYSLYESSNHQLSTEQIENSFAGNMCRCTGYRPILDAFKSLATNADEDLNRRVQDLEDLADIKCLKVGCNEACTAEDDDWCILNRECNNESISLAFKGGRWFKAYKILDIFNILAKEGVDSYRLVAGNTGQGVYPLKEQPRILIDISSIETLRESQIDVNLVLGAGMTLAEVMQKFQKLSADEDFSYLSHFYDHLDLVAHVPVRNIGTIGGNLALKNQYHDFPSDVYVMLATVQATITIMSSSMVETELGMVDFLKEDLKNKVIVNVKLPPLSKKNVIRTHKIMPRAQNAHAIMNAGFHFKMAADRVDEANIVYGCINAEFVNAKSTCSYLKGVNLFDNDVLERALRRLSDELSPDANPPEPSPDCRKMLALGLFYKTILNLAPEGKVNPRRKSGGDIFQRPISKGTQTFDTDKTLWPLNKPIPKLEALIQCSGEALYANDIPSLPREVFVAFVTATICKGAIERFDPSEALKIPGVVSFMTAKDIPGRNTFTPTSVVWQEFEEEILASKRVSYYGQPIALVTAVTEKLANRAAGIIKVFYEEDKKGPVLTIEDALAAPDSENRVRQEIVVKPTNRGVDTAKVIKGSYAIGSQYHYTMEPHTCVVVPTEDQYDVYSSTQWMDLVHVAVATCLNVPENLVNVCVRRVGGAYGGKASRAALAACACAAAARVLRRPARLAPALRTALAALGKRQPCRADYQVDIDNNGVVQYAEIKYYSDCGCNFNDSSGKEIAGTLTNLYDTSRWNIEGYSVLTDKASNTWCRAPATTEGTAILEHIMERIAHAVGRDAAEVRIANLAEKHQAVGDMIMTFKTECDMEARADEIKKYNKENAWRKRAIKLATMSYPIGYSGNFAVSISVYHGDGTVAVSHGGVEMGQGINTKIAQVCAHALQIPLEKISMKPSNNFVSPNAMASNGSVTSEAVAFAAARACAALLARLRPARARLGAAAGGARLGAAAGGARPGGARPGAPGAPGWERVVRAAYDRGVDLHVSYMMSENDELKGYSVYGVALAEVELDVLTGRHQLRRVDILEDTGQSMSPEIDVGQIEGAFIMGLGLWTSEHLIYDKETGRILTDRTWTYKPPGVKDIPIDFRINFKRNSYNTAGVLRSKATGEPALVMAVVVTHALHDAIVEARREYGHTGEDWVHVENPYTVENILRAISPNIENMRLT